ncbi:Uncharacterized protein dnm_082940 [Desulfonema magnum]|uniref:Uncharacterized protein n=1 Tax=Desulfonema magnum TaxID=45655 RepID=A0A975GTJ7_9BACT|nr:Uncharacterized protein dnm_082940 [Desulfonema magnum]
MSGVPNLQFGNISDARKPDTSAKLQVWHSGLTDIFLTSIYH